ncbi:MAG: response regulator [Bacteroidota bacterium]
MSDRDKIICQVNTKKNPDETFTKVKVKTMAPEPLSSFINITLKKDKKDLLVAESDEVSIIVIKALLERHNLAFELTTNEDEAISALEKNHFHIALIGINNIELIWENLVKKIWAENAESPKTFIFALTNNNINITIPDYLNNNFDKILIKPYKEIEIIKLIRKYKKLIPKRKSPLNNHTFNLEQLRKISNSDVFINKMLEKFIQSAQECSETLNSAFQKNDIDGLKKAAHKDIPSYSILGLKDLTDFLIFIENNNFSVDDLQMKNKLLDFDKRNSAIILEIKNYLSKH